MMRIPHFMDQDDYLQNPLLKRFLREHNIGHNENRADYLKAIEEYANENNEHEKEVKSWLLGIAKEGSKDICYRKIYGVEAKHHDPVVVENQIKEAFPDCPRKNLLEYHNTGESVMIDYEIVLDDSGEVVKVEFTYSQLFLYGNVNELGGKTVFPVFIELYLNQGFIVSRAKPKSTLYLYDENNAFLINDRRVDTMEHAMKLVDDIASVFSFRVEKDSRRAQNEVAKMLYNVYQKFSFTPEDVERQVVSQEDLLKQFVNDLFCNLHLDSRNKEKALLDAKILAEKFISINGDNEEEFKKDRDAYLIKISSDDELALTKIDTSSQKTVPLQCTEAFFDGKKSVMSSKKCKRLHLVFKRKDTKYFPSSNQLVVQMGFYKNYGYVKTMQYAEEADIQNVLQAVFENY